MNASTDQLHQLLETPLFTVTLTLIVFHGCLWLYRRGRFFPMLHPAITGAVVLALLLPRIGLDYAVYKQGTYWLELLLGPATVALAIPLYRQLALIRAMAAPILVTALVGAAVGALSALTFAWLLGGSVETLRSLAAKSVTTPIAIGITQELGGLVALATGAVMITAAIGITLAPLVFRLLRVDDPRIQGFALGVVSHGMGTARAFERSQVAGAFASLALCLVGILSAAAIPVAFLIFSD